MFNVPLLCHKEKIHLFHGSQGSGSTSLMICSEIIFNLTVQNATFSLASAHHTNLVNNLHRSSCTSGSCWDHWFQQFKSRIGFTYHCGEYLKRNLLIPKAQVWAHTPQLSQTNFWHSAKRDFVAQGYRFVCLSRCNSK